MSTILVFTTSNMVLGQKQDKLIKKANQAYANFAFYDAIEAFNQVKSFEPEVLRKKAMSYIRTGQTEAAEPILYELVTSGGYQREDLYNYAAVLRSNEKYRESEDWMKKYAELNQEDSRAQMYLRAKGTFVRLKQTNHNFKIYNLKMNSDVDDFAPTIYGDKVVFASSREKEIDPIRRRWNQTKSPFLDIYLAERNEQNDLINIEPISGKINSKYHDGPVAFNPAGDVMIFTRNSPSGRSEDGVIRLQMFESKMIDGEWQKPEPLPFNNMAYSVGHASFSHDGKTLYFASNMLGGLGGVDIYKANVFDDGTFGEPENLGKSVNTEGDEMFPFAHASGELLFFTSNGRVGLGGQDVFLAQIKKDASIGKVMNLGAPINTSDDDFGFVLSQDQTFGYFSSNREGGKGRDDIYGFDLSKPFSFGKTIRGIIREADGSPLADAEVRFFDLLTGQEERIKSGPDGSYEFVVEENKSFNIRGQKVNYFDANATTSTHTEAEVVEVNLSLIKDPGISIYAKITDQYSGKPLANVKLMVTDLITGKKEEIITSASGDYFKPLVGKSINEMGHYRFSMERSGFLSKEVDYKTVFAEKGKYEVHLMVDLTMTPIELGDDLIALLKMVPMSLKKDDTEIPTKYSKQLDVIVETLNANPNLALQIRAHTEAIGNGTSNQRITDKQAKMIEDYLSKQVSNPSRISSKGMGDKDPVFVNATADGGGENQILNSEFLKQIKATVNEDLYQSYLGKNRRIEFVVVGL